MCIPYSGELGLRLEGAQAFNYPVPADGDLTDVFKAVSVTFMLENEQKCGTEQVHNTQTNDIANIQ